MSGTEKIRSDTKLHCEVHTSDLHPVAAKSRSLIRITEGIEQTTIETIVRANPLVVARGTLQYIAINTLSRDMGLSETCLRLIKTVDVDIAKVNIGEAAWNARGEMATGCVGWTQTLVGEVDKMIVATESVIFYGLNFALQLVLDTFPIGSIADEREDRTNALDE